MNSCTNTPDRDSQLAQLARQHPNWEVWRGVSGLYYARQVGDAESVSGESPEDLADQIDRRERLQGFGQ